MMEKGGARTLKDRVSFARKKGAIRKPEIPCVLLTANVDNMKGRWDEK